MTSEVSSVGPTAPTHLRGVLSIAAAAIAWGTGGAVAVILQRHNNLGPVTVSFWRFVAAVTALAAVRAARRWRPQTRSRRRPGTERSVTSQPVAQRAPTPHPVTPQSVPAQSVPVQSVPVQSVPVQSVPVQSVPEQPGAVISVAQQGFAARRRSGRWRGVQWSTAIIGGVGLAVSQAAYFGSADTAGVALATLVTMGTCPVLIALGARYLLGERLTYGRMAAIGLALVGLVLLTLGPHAGGSDATLGILLALLSAATYSAVILQGRARQGQGEMLPAYVVGMLCLAPIAVVEGAVPDGGNVFVAVVWLMYLGLVPTVLAYQWFFAGLATVPAATASVIALLESVTAAAIAVGLLDERLSAASLAGMAVLLIAVTFMARGGRVVSGDLAAVDVEAEPVDAGIDTEPAEAGLAVRVDRDGSVPAD
ncbi:MAG TPA: EamA family transporter [Micromonosporaceae bacterium]|nr:EamA family transporter [Micromonosporaceae bacterium]